MKISCSVDCSQRRQQNVSDMFKAVNDSCITTEDITWSYCVGICIDGAAALTGHKKGFQAQVRHVAHVNFIHS
jgi:hypothetical protein